MVLATVVLLVIDRRLLEERKRGGEGEGGGRVGGNYFPTDAALLAWVRCGVEFLPAAILSVLSLSVFLLCFLFFLSWLYYAACTWNSVYIRPVCINALSSRETPSRLGLHNNALNLRESTSRLGLHNNALGLRETPSRLSCINVLSLWGTQMLL